MEARVKIWLSLLRWLTALMGLLLFAAFAAGVAGFARRTQPTFIPGTTPLAGVVFTGQFNRVHAGLGLFERGTISPLLVSGTNPPAGIPLAGFAQQFQLSPILRAALANGALVLTHTQPTPCKTPPKPASGWPPSPQVRRWCSSHPAFTCPAHR